MLKIIPIKKQELLKFTITSLIMLMILFIYSVERTIKDTIIIDEMGPEFLSAIKLYCTLPIAIIIMLIYTKITNYINKSTIFHIFNFFFIFYFMFFTFIMAPNIESYHFTLNITYSSNIYKIMRYFICIIENWSYSLYFVLSELWGSIMLSLMFWQTANEVFDINQAKRLYPLFGLVAQLGMIISGTLLKRLSNKNIFQKWQESLECINISVLIASVCLSILYWLLDKYTNSNKIKKQDIKKKNNNNLFNNIKYILRSKYIRLIATLIICYGISINIVEAIWKAQATLIYCDKQDYTNFMANLQTYTGIISMIIMFSGSYILTKISWLKSALLTPVIVLITGSCFYIFSIFKKEIIYIFPNININPLIIAINIGLIQNIIVKSTKYAFFDATKEIAYIPLEENLKTKGKAAADVIGGRLGKSGGALIQQLLLVLFLIIDPSSSKSNKGELLISLSPIIFVIFICFMIIWISSVYSLAQEFKKIEKINNEKLIK